MKWLHLSILFLHVSTSLSFAKTELKIGTDDWPPYEYMEGSAGNDYVTGFSTEVVLSVLQSMNVGVKNRIGVFPWVRAEMMLVTGELDVLYSAATNHERAKIVHYPDESLMETSWSFFIRKEDEKKIWFNHLDDFKDKKIGIVRGYFYSSEFMDFIKKNKKTEDVAFDEQNIKKLLHKRVDVIVMDKMNARYLLRKMGLSGKITCLRKPLRKVSLYAIFSRNTVDSSFVTSFSEHLRKFKKTEEYMLIYGKYFGDQNQPVLTRSQDEKPSCDN